MKNTPMKTIYQWAVVNREDGRAWKIFYTRKDAQEYLPFTHGGAMCWRIAKVKIEEVTNGSKD